MKYRKGLCNTYTFRGTGDFSAPPPLRTPEPPSSPEEFWAPLPIGGHARARQGGQILKIGREGQRYEIRNFLIKVDFLPLARLTAGRDLKSPDPADTSSQPPLRV